MKKIGKTLFRYVLAPILLLCLITVIGLLLFRACRQYEIRQETRIASSNGIESLEKITLGGIEQWISIRGVDKTKPVLLHLHGGPGGAEIPLARYFDRELEKHFVVVKWDQRGAGKSFNRNIPLDSMNIEQFILDTRELAGMLKTRFSAQKIYLLGHSWGSALAARTASRYPELFYAFIGVGQYVNGPENEEICYKFTLEKARESQNQKALRELQEIGAPPWDNLEELFIQRKWLEEFGGVHHLKIPNLWLMGALSPDASLMDGLRYNRGQRFSLQNMWKISMTTDLFEQAPRIDTPVYFFLGRHDFNTPTELAVRYYERLDAPQGKQIIWFDDCGHMIPFEAPAEYSDAIIHRVLKETYP